MNAKLPPELLVLLVSAVPVVEMKGGIPLGLARGLSPLEATLIAIVGTCLQIPFNLLLIELLGRLAHRNPYAHRFLLWSQERSHKQKDLINRWGLLGVAVLVGIPIPGTGLWTGTVAGYLIGLHRWTLVLGLVLGTLMAGTIVGLAAAGVTRLL